MTTEQLREEVQELQAQCDALRSLWKQLVCDTFVPSPSQFDTWLNNCSLDEVAYAIRKTGRKHDQLVQMSSDHMLRYCSKVMNNRNSERGQL